MEQKKSAALAWTKELIAPRVIASGRNLTAERMLEIADQYGIRVIHDPLLADILCDTEIGSYIPEETYEAVAAIFAFLDKVISEELF